MRHIGVGLLLISILLSACSEVYSPSTPMSPSRVSASAFHVPQIFTNPNEFASILRSVNSDIELLIRYKHPATPPISEQVFRRLPPSVNVIVGLPTVSAKSSARSSWSLPSSPQAAETITTLLAKSAIVPYLHLEHDNFLAVRIPDTSLDRMLDILMNHPSVDYIVPNTARSVIPVADPIGSNPVDAKHTAVHNITGAWDFTRGGPGWDYEPGVTIGILDSGYSGTSSAHPDGQYSGPINSTFGAGIRRLGFSDDYSCSFPGQAYGYCTVSDDNGHGTAMAGLVGENDNSIGYVGVAPWAATLSMKITHNTYISGNSCNGYSTDYCIEDDDMLAALSFAKSQDVEILSMSFCGGFSSSIVLSLQDAYEDHDILLFAATGNSSGLVCDPAGYPFVIGVGGVTGTSTNYGSDVNQEVSGFVQGFTTVASCPSTAIYVYGWCSSNGYAVPGGTSSSTATVAGIAGLVRAYNPWMSAATVRSRLSSTSSGSPHYTVNARKAVDVFGYP